MTEPQTTLRISMNCTTTLTASGMKDQRPRTASRAHSLHHLAATMFSIHGRLDSLVMAVSVLLANCPSMRANGSTDAKSCHRGLFFRQSTRPEELRRENRFQLSSVPTANEKQRDRDEYNQVARRRASIPSAHTGTLMIDTPSTKEAR